MNSAYLTVFSAMMRELAGVSVNRPQSHRLAVSGDNMSEELDFNKANDGTRRYKLVYHSRCSLLGTLAQDTQTGRQVALRNTEK